MLPHTLHINVLIWNYADMKLNATWAAVTIWMQFKPNIYFFIYFFYFHVNNKCDVTFFLLAARCMNLF